MPQKDVVSILVLVDLAFKWTRGVHMRKIKAEFQSLF